MSDRIKAFFKRNQEEIVEIIMGKKHIDEQDSENNTKTGNKNQSEKSLIIPMVILSIIYLFAGFILIHYKNVIGKMYFIVGLVLIIIGVYAAIYSFLFLVLHSRHKDNFLVRLLSFISFLVMIIYHGCIKIIKNLIKDIRQGHVTKYIPYYLFFLYVILILMSIVLNLVSKREINREYTESIGFLIVCASIGVFRILEYIFAYLFNKFDFWLNDIVKYKNITKINYRYLVNQSKEIRKIDAKKEWETIKEELKLTSIYLYIFAIVIVLLLPKEDEIIALLSNQFLGIATITALAREARGKLVEFTTI